ncbi:cytosolic sulfotransferase 12-like protein [Cinnamomum micranthum f. kanehirae]|uniref:Sulfotransferase n=1 Tax=Cinnamomum micranthum f. kanehirae TaxID=337451 RepID=A0A3S3PTV3_9MAGN|nr:cytosolic sulfotransferase 12-like protein [Cinnamomum micranthum f. kanehirae]
MVISKQQQEGDALPIEMGKEDYVDGFTESFFIQFSSNFDTIAIIFIMATSNIVPEHEVLGITNKNFFRRGIVGDWKNHLTAEMSEKPDQLSQQKLEAFGLTFKDLSQNSSKRADALPIEMGKEE